MIRKNVNTSFEMSVSEHLSIVQKYELESSAYVAIMKVIMLIGVLLGTLVWLIEIWHNAHVTMLLDETHVAVYAFIILIVFVIFVAVTVYLATVRPLFLDVVKKTKTVAVVSIIYKESFPDYNIYKITTTHFYTPIIDVNKNDFDDFRIGDEINIEYAAHSKEFFNYF